MQAVSRVLVQLQSETRALQPEADWPWLELMALEASRARYVDHLSSLYGFEAPVEAALGLTPHLGEVIELRTRSRSGLLVEDLLALGQSAARIARLPQCRHVAPFRDAAEGLGWLYVLERSTLLHETVYRYMAPRLPSVAAWRYLRAYHGGASARWQQLGAALDAYAITPASIECIVAAARTAFACLRDWFASERASAAQRAHLHL